MRFGHVAGGLALATVLVLAPGLSAQAAEKDGHKANELDSEHIFGFTEGSDIGEKGEKEAEVEPLMRFGKRTGSYFATSTAFLYKYSLTDDFRVAPVFSLSSHSISGVTDLDDRHSFDFEGTGAEIRYRLLNREKAPFGALFDKELIHDRLFGALNFGYEPAWTKVKATDESERSSALSMSGALSTVVRPGVVVGMELRYARDYDGIGLNTFVGDALFLGPSIMIKVSDKAFVSAAWNTQVAGHASGESGSLNLTDFERNQIRLRFGVELD